SHPQEEQEIRERPESEIAHLECPLLYLSIFFINPTSKSYRDFKTIRISTTLIFISTKYRTFAKNPSSRASLDMVRNFASSLFILLIIAAPIRSFVVLRFLGRNR